MVRQFDLTAPGGSVVAVLGPNGAGKTTLLNTLSGLLPAQAGSVSVDGQTASRSDARPTRPTPG